MAERTTVCNLKHGNRGSIDMTAGSLQLLITDREAKSSGEVAN